MHNCLCHGSPFLLPWDEIRRTYLLYLFRVFSRKSLRQQHYNIDRCHHNIRQATTSTVRQECFCCLYVVDTSIVRKDKNQGRAGAHAHTKRFFFTFSLRTALPRRVCHVHATPALDADTPWMLTTPRSSRKQAAKTIGKVGMFKVRGGSEGIIVDRETRS